MTIHRMNWTDVNLGLEPDADLARRLGIHRNLVTVARNRRGIPAFGSTAPARPSRVVPHSAPSIDWDAEPLGQETDYAIAKRLCIPVHRVNYQRARRNLAPATAGTRNPPPPRVKREIPDPVVGPWAERWTTYPATIDACRCCPSGVGRSGNEPRRWTDQGPCCAAHYGTLPPCAGCGTAPAANPEEWCEACCAAHERACWEAVGWRSSGQENAPPSSLDIGSLVVMRAGLARFEANHGPARVVRR